MDVLGGAGPISASIFPQRELSPGVGQHLIEAEGIELLTLGQKGHGTGHVPRRGDLHRHQPGGPIDGDEQIPARSTPTWQRTGIDVQELLGDIREPGHAVGSGDAGGCGVDGVVTGPNPATRPSVASPASVVLPGARPSATGAGGLSAPCERAAGYVATVATLTPNALACTREGGNWGESACADGRSSVCCRVWSWSHLSR